MVKKVLMFLACLLTATSMAFAQFEQVTGTVIDGDTGEPLAGASVKVIGTTMGTLTDINGKFTLKNLPKSATQIEVSFMGMNAVRTAVKRNMAITMTANASDLDEVMVVAYGTAKKSTFTGSAAVLNSEEIEKVQVTNAVDALKGKVSGVQINTATGQPGSTPTIRIRGFNTLSDVYGVSGGNDPLIVLDGSPFGGNLNDINPHDVESMTVLKDAASTALYGARGGNGVILITTKSAKKGRDAVITFDAKWGGNSKAVPEYNTVNTAAGHYEMWYKALKNYRTMNVGDSEEAAHLWANQNLINSSSYGLIYNVFNVPQGQDLIGTNGKLNPNATLGNIITGADGQQHMLLPDNWIDETYHTSLRQEYSLTASAASEKGTFYASANYLKNDGITYGSGYERFSGRIKADYMLKKWLKVGANVAYSHFDRDALGEDGSAGSSGNAFAFGTMAPIYPMYVRDAFGNIIMHDATGLQLYDYGQGTQYYGLTRPYLQQSNPVMDNRIQINNECGNSFNGVGFAEIYLPYGFTLHSINAIGLNASRYASTTQRYFGGYSAQNGQNQIEHDRYSTNNYQQRLNWHQTYGKHDVEAMIGHEYYQSRSTDLYGYKNNTFSDTNPELNSAVVMGSTASSASYYNTEQLLARAMYSFDDRYFAMGSFVRQASSRFHPDHRWGNFWSASAGWNIHKEKFFKAKWVDELKIKASYGENGNDRIPSYLYTDRFSITNSSDQIALVPNSVLKNDKITWETEAKFNTGVDFSFFGGRLSGVVEYYRNQTRDMLASFPLPPSFGYTSFFDNVGDMLNQGVEAELRGEIFRTKDFTWDVYANTTYNSNRVTYLPEERKSMKFDGVRGFSSGSYYFGEGISRFTYFGKKFLGVYSESNYYLTGDQQYDPSKGGLAMYDKIIYKQDPQTKEYILDENGFKIEDGNVATTKYSDASDHLLGDCLPTLYGGFGTGLSYKGFDLGVDFQYQIGGKVYDSTYATLMGCNRGYAFHTDMLNAWTPENQNVDIPRLAFNEVDRMNAASDRFLTDASYLHLANITFGYTLPANLLKNIHVNKVRVYVVADNVATWSKRKGLDPRQSATGSNTGSFYKPVRTISGGISVTF